MTLSEGSAKAASSVALFARFWKLSLGTFVSCYCDALITLLLPAIFENIYEGDDEAALRATSAANAMNRICQFMCLPMIGMFCDLRGRKFVMMFSLVGASASYLMVGFTFTRPMAFLAVIGMSLQGATSGFTPGVRSMIADTTLLVERPAAYAINDILGLFFPYIFAPLTGTLVLMYTNVPLQVLFLGTAVLCAACFIFLWILLPETLDKSEKRASFSWARANPLGSFITLWSRNPFFRLFSFGIFFAGLSFSVPMTIAFWYVRERYSASTSQYLMSVVAVAVASVISCASAGPVSALIGERKALLGGLLLGMLGTLGCGLSPVFGLYVVSNAVFGLFGLVFPMCSSLTSKNCSTDMLGQVASAIVSVILVSTATGSIAAAAAYTALNADASSDSFSHSIVWIACAALFFVSFIVEVICFWMYPHNRVHIVGITEHLVIPSSLSKTDCVEEAESAETDSLLTTPVAV
jgi:DHA1 family tetracycline resistance protein-like MFS transporter